MRFYADNARWLAAGTALAFASGYGQTFFISIHAGGIRSSFGLSHGEWGSVYTIGTLASAVLMLWAGALVDRLTIRTVAIICIIGLSAVSLMMAINTLAWALVPIVCGLRFFGQGMLSHISVVSMGRWFAQNRGKAVAISSLGFAIAEASLPIVFVAFIAGFGWRGSWVWAAGLGLLMVPVIAALLVSERDPKSRTMSVETTGMNDRHWQRRDALGHWLFWVTLPAFIGPPMFSTALFFHQVHFAEFKGWSLASFVTLIPFSTAAAVVTMLATGWLVGRTGSRLLLPLFPLPFIASFLLFGNSGSILVAGIAFAFHGVGQGYLGALNGTFWPEIYGTRHLGAIRAIAVSAMVFGSAIGPGITGYMIDIGYPFEDQMFAIAIYMAASAALTAFAMSRIKASFDSA